MDSPTFANAPRSLSPGVLASGASEDSGDERRESPGESISFRSLRSLQSMDSPTLANAPRSLSPGESTILRREHLRELRR